MMGNVPGPRPKLILQHWQPRTLEEAQQLYDLMVSRGVPRGTARVMLARLQTLPEKGPLTNGQRVERSKLRVFLARLGEPPWPPERGSGDGGLSPLSSVESGARGAKRLPRPVSSCYLDAVGRAA
jgi:hypothetical protein